MPNTENIYGKIDFDKSVATLNASDNSNIATTTIKDKNYTLLLYGSVFNIASLQKENATKINQAKVLLDLFLKHDTKAFELLNGMYAFAIYESTEKRLILVRDRIGDRSLLYTIKDNIITFASDFPTLFADKTVKAVLTKESLYHIFLLGPAHSPTSGVFKDILAMPAGYYLERTPADSKLIQYWGLKTKEINTTVTKAVEKARDLITTSVVDTLTTEEPPALLLSGGLDSSIVGTVANEHYKKTNKQLKTYSIDFEDSRKDFLQNTFQPTLDKDFTQIMVTYLKSDHKDVVLSNLSLGEALEEAAIIRGLPGMADVDSSLLLFSKEIAKNHKLGLSGECADEIFGGYPWYHTPEIRDFDGFPWSRSLEMRTKLLKNSDENYAKEFVQSHYKDTIKDIEYLSNENEAERRIRQLFVLNLSWFGATLLERKERMTVASGLTVRMPFTDYRLIEWAYNLPFAFKALDGREKGIMRKAFEDMLPKEIVARKKSPFPKTYSPVYLEYVKQGIDKILQSNGTIKELIDVDYLKTLLEVDPNDVTVAPWYGQLMRIPQVFAFIIQLDVIIKKYNVTIE